MASLKFTAKLCQEPEAYYKEISSMDGAQLTINEFVFFFIVLGFGIWLPWLIIKIWLYMLLFVWIYTGSIFELYCINELVIAASLHTIVFRHFQEASSTYRYIEMTNNYIDIRQRRFVISRGDSPGSCLILPAARCGKDTRIPIPCSNYVVHLAMYVLKRGRVQN